MRTNEKEIDRNNTLTSLEYAGLETLFQRIVSTYEDYLGVPLEDQTPVPQIIRRTGKGIEIFDGAYDLYLIEGFAVREIYKQYDTCIMAGFHTDGQKIEDCFDNPSDILIDLTPFLDEQYIDIDWLIEKISGTR